MGGIWLQVHPSWKKPEFRRKAVVAFLLVFLAGTIFSKLGDRYFIGLNLRPEVCIDNARVMVIDKSLAGQAGRLMKGDVVAFRNKAFVKRFGPSVVGAKFVAGVAGDTVTVKDGEIMVNDSSWGRLSLVDFGKLPGPVELYSTKYVIPEGHVLMLGTSAKSYDGRYWGLLKSDEILGRAAFYF